MTADALHALLRGPVIVAPMAGGPSTPALVVAAADAGALGFLAAGYKTPDLLASEMNAVRAGTSEAFGVNLFVPGAPTARPDETTRYLGSLARDAEIVGASVGDPVWDDDHWDAKLALLLADPPAVVSFTFGCPPRATVDALRRAGAVVAVTVTQPSEALLAVAVDPDCLVVQGIEAGAHRGTFANDDRFDDDGLELLALMAEVARVTDLAQIAAGGMMMASDVAGVLRAGATAAQCGTAFLRCPESGAADVYKDALGDERFTATALTRSFSGRPARGLVNRFILDHPDAPPAYPEINNATRPLRAAAARAGDVDRMSLWAGTGFASATTEAAGAIVERLSRI